MKIRDFVPPVLAGWIARSFASDFARARDLDGEGERGSARLLAPYAQSPAVFAAVNLVSGEFSGLELKFYQGDQEVDDSALAAWWARPAQGPAGSRLPRAMVDQLLAMWEQLEGEYFLILDESWVVTAGRPVAGYAPFIVAAPARMAVVVQGGELVGWRYTDAGGRQHYLVPEQVVHHRTPNPYDDWRGLGRQQVAAVEIEGVFLTGVFVRDMMRNNGDQGAIVIAKSGVVDDKQREQVAADLRAKRAALRRGQARDLFLTGDIAVDRPEQQAASADLSATRTVSVQDIFLAFGVPPSMATVKQAYSLGKDSDRYQLITSRSQPLSRTIAGTYGELAGRQLRRELTAEHEWDDHPVLQEVRNARIEAGLKLWATGLSWETINDYLGLGMQPFEGWDVGYLPFSVAPVGAAETAVPAPDASADPTLAEPAADSPDVAKLRLLVLARSRQRSAQAAPGVSLPEEFRVFACTCHGDSSSQLSALSSQLSDSDRRLWKSHMAQRVESLKSFQSGIRRELMQARAETLAKIEKLYTKSVATKAAVADLVFDQAKFKDGLLATLRKRAQKTLETAGQQLFKEVGRDDPFVYPPREALTFLAERENKLAGVPDEIHASIKATLEEGILAGDTSAQLAGRVRAAFNDAADGRATTIAATEVGACYGNARDVAMREAGVPAKMWLTSGNDNVRPAHAAANGQTVPIDEPFIVDGEQLQYPGDSAGSPGNVIRCHCVSIAKAST